MLGKRRNGYGPRGLYTKGKGLELPSNPLVNTTTVVPEGMALPVFRTKANNPFMPRMATCNELLLVGNFSAEPPTRISVSKSISYIIQTRSINFISLYKSSTTASHCIASVSLYILSDVFVVDSTLLVPFTILIDTSIQLSTRPCVLLQAPSLILILARQRKQLFPCHQTW